MLNASYLNETLELGLAVKKLALLGAYLSIFFIIASVVRKSEIRPFLNFMLVLAVICAVGVLWEYRFDFNIFYSWSEKLLPGAFQFTSSGADGVDEIGRKLVVGPAEHGLEVVAMLSMALPIAIRRADAVDPWARSGALRLRDLRAGRRDARDLPQERDPGADLGLPRPRLLPSPRAAQTRSASAWSC